MGPSPVGLLEAMQGLSSIPPPIRKTDMERWECRLLPRAR